MTTSPLASVRRHVSVVSWPAPGAPAARARARLAGAACLLVVGDGAAPPTDCDRDEDWTTLSAPGGDLDARLGRLAARPAQPCLLSPIVLDGLPDAAVALLDLLERRRPRATPRPAAADVVGTDNDLEDALAHVRRVVQAAGYDVLADDGALLLAGVGTGRSFSAPGR